MSEPAAAAVEAARRLAGSTRLAGRRFELLPLSGPGAAFTQVQGRAPGESSAPEGLAELISSIDTIGVLQPILVEELADGRHRLVAGERRLRAAKWLAASQPDEERHQSIPAVVCPGPLSEEERRVWQLVENLAREDLRPGELAAALLYERCAVLASRLLAAGVAVPADVTALEDPVARFAALDRLRLAAGQSRLGAPWPEVLRRLGVQLSERKAQQLVRAFAALPQELSAEMDAAKIALHPAALSAPGRRQPSGRPRDLGGGQAARPTRAARGRGRRAARRPHPRRRGGGRRRPCGARRRRRRPPSRGPGPARPRPRQRGRGPAEP